LQLQAGQNYGQFAGLANQEQNTQLAAAQDYLAQGTLGQQEQNTMLSAAGTAAGLGSQAQQQQIAGANAVYNVGQQQQQQGQSELTAAYQQYLNQVNWPYQMLNVQESALANSPYNVQTAVTLPNANSTAQGFGTLAGAAGLLGQLGGSTNQAPAGGGSPF